MAQARQKRQNSAAQRVADTALPLRTLYAIFALSGLAGLIYEASWTRYLGLFLGHAAYAQVLVLSLFMGGMGAGALIVSRLGQSRIRPLLLYGLIEATLGVFGLAFHPLYDTVTSAAYASWLPGLQSDSAAMMLQWSLAAALIVPQSMLLGMTFPAMSTAMVRGQSAGGSGRPFALLYATNSAGAVIGVLLSAFWFTEHYGLQGTMIIAGVINLVVAAVAIRLAIRLSMRGARPPVPVARAPAGPIGVAMIAIAFFTAVSSFFYEIAWLRMMALVQGASTHAFETMLAAFILGIALGGWWIRNRIDAFDHPLGALGIVQIAMGVAALATLPMYPYTFDLMQLAIAKLPHSNIGYAGFNFVGALLSALVMLPASVFAGMTLPLLTAFLYTRGRGEREIGRVYGWNSLGGIVGVLAGGLLLLPAIGLRNLVVAGAAIDIALGIALVVHQRRSLPHASGVLPRVLVATAIAGVAALGAAMILPDFDRTRTLSGVFRTGRAQLPESWRIVSYADGRTASVSTIRLPNGNLAIATNGKIDASINMERGQLYTRSPDEYTMTLLGALPLAYKPDARRAAVIGHGSGLTAHVMLGSPAIAHVDIIEIEPEMIRAARQFLPRVSRAYDDPRSHFQLEDARAYFARSREPYDVIVSEPSNPWVSGVASLFTVEFYQHAKRALKPDGLFVQWFHLYETNRPLVQSIVGAIGQVFSDYVIYAANDTDAVLVATSAGRLPVIGNEIFQWPDLRAELTRLDLRTAEQLRLLRVANRRGYGPWLEGAPLNSDYLPILEFGAARARFVDSDDSILIELARDPVPILEMLSGFDAPAPAATSIAVSRETPRFYDLMRANAIASALAGVAQPRPEDGLTPAESQSIARARAVDANVDAASWQDWFEALFILSKTMLTNGSAGAIDRFVHSSTVHSALPRAPAIVRDKVDFLLAIGARNIERIERSGALLLDGPMRESDPAFHAYTLVSTITACLARPVDSSCAQVVALLDRVQSKSAVFDLLRAHRRAASIR